MRRGYDREGYLAKIRGSARAHAGALPAEPTSSSGFPTETEADFEQTLSLLEEVEIRHGLLVHVLDRVREPRRRASAPIFPRSVKFERLARLNALQKPIQERRNRRWIGRTVEVLVEGPNRAECREWTGRTPEARWVHFGGNSAPGRLETRPRRRRHRAYLTSWRNRRRGLTLRKPALIVPVFLGARMAVEMKVKGLDVGSGFPHAHRHPQNAGRGEPPSRSSWGCSRRTRSRSSSTGVSRLAR